MRISNFGMGVLHVKVKYWRIFCDVISLLAIVFILSPNRVPKEVSMKNWNFSMAQFLWYDCTFKKQDTIPVTLTFHLWRSIYLKYNHISILYKFQIDISSNSREIKYQNIGRTHRYTHRQTRWKQYLATASGGEVIIVKVLVLVDYRINLILQVIFQGGGRSYNTTSPIENPTLLICRITPPVDCHPAAYNLLHGGDPGVLPPLL